MLNGLDYVINLPLRETLVYASLDYVAGEVKKVGTLGYLGLKLKKLNGS